MRIGRKVDARDARAGGRRHCGHTPRCRLDGAYRPRATFVDHDREQAPIRRAIDVIDIPWDVACHGFDAAAGGFEPGELAELAVAIGHHEDAAIESE